MIDLLFFAAESLLLLFFVLMIILNMIVKGIVDGIVYACRKVYRLCTRINILDDLKTLDDVILKKTHEKK
jgi:predicted DNA-binding protein (UPF0278 family)